MFMKNEVDYKIRTHLLRLCFLPIIIKKVIPLQSSLAHFSKLPYYFWYCTACHSLPPSLELEGALGACLIPVPRLTFDWPSVSFTRIESLATTTRDPVQLLPRSFSFPATFPFPFFARVSSYRFSGGTQL